MILFYEKQTRDMVFEKKHEIRKMVMKQKEIFTDQLIVITGAAGFIGSCVVRCLNDRGYHNLLLVDEIGKTDKWKNLLGKKFVDIIPQEKLFSFLEGREREIEAFIHLGAITDTRETDGNLLLENNYRFSISLCEYALKHEHRFIYASSAATYGDGTKGFNDDEEKIEELRPLNLYGYSKQLFDLWLKREDALDKVVGLKFFNVFGPNENHKGSMASIIFHMHNSFLREKKVKLFKSTDPKIMDGDQKRDFIYVKDAAKMVCNLLNDAFKDISGIFNIGTGRATTFNEMASYFFEALQQMPNIQYIEMPQELRAQYQNYTCGEMDKYLRIHKLNKLPVMTVKDAVIDYVTNYLSKDERW